MKAPYCLLHSLRRGIVAPHRLLSFAGGLVFLLLLHGGHSARRCAYASKALPPKNHRYHPFSVFPVSDRPSLTSAPCLRMKEKSFPELQRELKKDQFGDKENFYNNVDDDGGAYAFDVNIDQEKGKDKKEKGKDNKKKGKDKDVEGNEKTEDKGKGNQPGKDWTNTTVEDDLVDKPPPVLKEPKTQDETPQTYPPTPMPTAVPTADPTQPEIYTTMPTHESPDVALVPTNMPMHEVQHFDLLPTSLPTVSSEDYYLDDASSVPDVTATLEIQPTASPIESSNEVSPTSQTSEEFALLPVFGIEVFVDNSQQPLDPQTLLADVESLASAFLWTSLERVYGDNFLRLSFDLRLEEDERRAVRRLGGDAPVIVRAKALGVAYFVMGTAPSGADLESNVKKALGEDRFLDFVRKSDASVQRVGIAVDVDEPKMSTPTTSASLNVAATDALPSKKFSTLTVGIVAGVSASVLALAGFAALTKRRISQSAKQSETDFNASPSPPKAVVQENGPKTVTEHVFPDLLSISMMDSASSMTFTATSRKSREMRESNDSSSCKSSMAECASHEMGTSVSTNELVFNLAYPRTSANMETSSLVRTNMQGNANASMTASHLFNMSDLNDNSSYEFSILGNEASKVGEGAFSKSSLGIGPKGKDVSDSLPTSRGYSQSESLEKKALVSSTLSEDFDFDTAHNVSHRGLSYSFSNKETAASIDAVAIVEDIVPYDEVKTEDSSEMGKSTQDDGPGETMPPNTCEDRFNGETASSQCPSRTESFVSRILNTERAGYEHARSIGRTLLQQQSQMEDRNRELPYVESTVRRKDQDGGGAESTTIGDVHQLGGTSSGESESGSPGADSDEPYFCKEDFVRNGNSGKKGGVMFI